jgi:hypothetical protein
MYYNFEIFHMREKQIPVDSVEIKEVIHAFAWEPVGSKFAIVHGDGPNISVSFYGVKTGQIPTLLSKCLIRSDLLNKDIQSHSHSSECCTSNKQHIRFSCILYNKNVLV